MKLNIEFQNYKLLKDTKATLDGSNVYLVQGANEQGKTSFINGLLTMLQAENKTKQPVTIGEKKGKISLDLQTKGGKDFKILFEFTDEKNKFTLISNNQLMSKVTDIRSFLQYQSLTADEFISWSNTAEGKRKQRDIVLGLLGQTVKEKFVELTGKESATYEERATINSDIKTLEAIISQWSYTITNDEKQQIENIEKYKTEKSNIAETIESNAALKSLAESMNREWDAILHSCEILNNFTGKLAPKNLENIISLVQQSKVSVPKINYDRYNELAELIQKLSILSDNQKRYKEQDDKLAILQKESESLTDEITKLRQAKTKLIADSNFPIQDVVIDDECLLIKTKDGLLPFDINQVSTSRIMIIVAKIILMLNKHLPIIVMGRGEAFDKEKLAELSKFADENECMLIIDKVTDTAGIEIVGYENA